MVTSTVQGSPLITSKTVENIVSSPGDKFNNGDVVDCFSSISNLVSDLLKLSRTMLDSFFRAGSSGAGVETLASASWSVTAPRSPFLDKRRHYKEICARLA